MVSNDFDPEPRRPASLVKVSEIGDISVDLKGRPSDKSRTGGWLAAHFVFGVLAMEIMVSYGLVANLVIYLVFVEYFQIADAANASTNWLGANYLLTVVGAFISDAFLGRYRTIVCSSIILVAGYVVLIATVATFRPPACLSPISCKAAGSKYLAPLYTGLYLIALGSAGVRPNINALGADQFDDSDPKEAKQGRTYFNISFVYAQIGAALGITFMVYMQDHVSFQAAYGTMMACYIVVFLALILGTPLYRHKVPSGSPLTRAAQVIVAAIHKWREPLPAKPDELLEVLNSDASVIKGSRKLAHTNKFRFLDKAAVVTGPHEKPDPWRLVTVTQVEELKRVLLMLPIWLCTAVIYIVFAQFTALVVQQGSTMDLHLGPHFIVPAASLSIFGFVAGILLVIPYTFLVPYVRKLTGHKLGITPLQRIGIGIIFGSLSAVVAALLERKRLTYVRELGLENQIIGTFVIKQMKIYWIVPQYVCLAVTELFIFVGQNEFFFGESPDGLRSLALSLTHSSQALGFLLSSPLVNSVNHYTERTSYGAWLIERLNNGGLEKFFWLLAVLVIIDYAIFLVCCYFYEYKQIIPPETGVHIPMWPAEVESTGDVNYQESVEQPEN